MAEWSKALDLGSSLRAWVRTPPLSTLFCWLSSYYVSVSPSLPRLTPQHQHHILFPIPISHFYFPFFPHFPILIHTIFHNDLSKFFMNCFHLNKTFWNIAFNCKVTPTCKCKVLFLFCFWLRPRWASSSESRPLY